MVTKCFFIVLFCLAGSVLAQDEDFEALMEMINDNIVAANSYTIPSDNSKLLELDDDEIHELPDSDFIVVGAGSAGAVLASRLSEIENWNVLLLEAGKRETEFFDILSLSSAYGLFSESNWGYNSTAQKNACQAMVDKKCNYDRGRIRGGCNTISHGVYTNGNPMDFTRWESLGNKGWGWEDVRPYFLKLENAVFEGQDEGYHGKNGPLYVDVTSETPGLEPVMSDAFAEIGIERGDINGANQTRLDKIQFFLNRNRRSGVAKGYLDPAEETRPNFKLSLSSFVTKILIDKTTKTAYGVEFIREGIKYRVKATREVILSAGAINSPQLLILSGVGPAEHLNELNIDLVEDLPVGENMEDHVGYIGAYYRTPNTYWDMTDPELILRWTQNLRPFTAGLAAEMIGFTNVNGGSLGRPDMEFAVLNSVFPTPALAKVFRLNDEYAASYDNTLNDVFFVLALQHPKSRGYIKLQSNDIKDLPIIEPNFFSDEEGYDIETMYQGIQFLLSLNETTTFADFGAVFHNVPLPSCDREFEPMTKDWWICGIKALSIAFFYPTGTTRMGQSVTNSVVNERLLVHGINNLRVVDAGVMPETITGHIDGVVIMMAEKAADIIKEDYNQL